MVYTHSQGCLQSLRQESLSLLKRYFTVLKHLPKTDKSMGQFIIVLMYNNHRRLFTCAHVLSSVDKSSSIIKYLIALTGFFVENITRLPFIRRKCVFRTFTSNSLTQAKTRVKTSLIRA